VEKVHQIVLPRAKTWFGEVERRTAGGRTFESAMSISPSQILVMERQGLNIFALDFFPL
jgi:hypothetical protein